MGIPHFLLIPYPSQGHVNPLMHLSQLLIKQGCKITFLNTEFSHKRAIAAAGAWQDNNLTEQQIRFVTLPDGVEPEDDRSDGLKVLHSIETNMPALLPKLIQDINDLDADNKISCIVVTFNMSWALDVGHKLGIRGAFLWTGSATMMAYCNSIPKLIDDGIIDSAGVPIKKQAFQLSPDMPMMDMEKFPWRFLGKTIFDVIAQEMQTMKLAQWWLCNTTYDLESAPISISPRCLPIGPLIPNDTNKCSLWQEDTTCLDWLDQHPPQSVIYVSFGSFVVMEPNQFKELALALDHLKKPFLWVVRKDNGTKENNALIHDVFRGSKGKIVSWAPQKKILNHPAIGCFISHCGWNSVLESVCEGVPFLCWPLASDQFVNKSCICDVWKVGVGLDEDENGLISKEEIGKKVEQVLGDEDMKARSLKLKELTVNCIEEGGSSSKNLENFVNWAKI